MYNDIDVVGAIPQVLPHMPQGFPMGSGHSSDLDLKKNGMLHSFKNQTFRWTKSLNEWCLHLEKADIFFFSETSASVREHTKPWRSWTWNIDAPPRGPDDRGPISSNFVAFSPVLCGLSARSWVLLFLILLVAFCSWWFRKFVLYPVCRSFKEIRRLWWKVPRSRHWEPSTKGPSCFRDTRIWLTKDGKIQRSLTYLTSWLIWVQ